MVGTFAGQRNIAMALSSYGTVCLNFLLKVTLTRWKTELLRKFVASWNQIAQMSTYLLQQFSFLSWQWNLKYDTSCFSLQSCKKYYSVLTTHELPCFAQLLISQRHELYRLYKATGILGFCQIVEQKCWDDNLVRQWNKTGPVSVFRISLQESIKYYCCKIKSFKPELKSVPNLRTQKPLFQFFLQH